MARQKKTRKISDIMPVRKTDKLPPMAQVKSKKGRKPTRYELDVLAREEKRKKKHKGLSAGSRHSAVDNNKKNQSAVKSDPRIGSRKKIPLMIEMVNKPEKGKVITPIKPETTDVKIPRIANVICDAFMASLKRLNLSILSISDLNSKSCSDGLTRMVSLLYLIVCKTESLSNITSEIFPVKSSFTF